MEPVANSTQSYWRANPHALEDYRSGAIVPATCDIAIIGAGMAGVATAYHLLRAHGAGLQVAIFDARGACSGATGRNGGHTKASPVTSQGIEKAFGPATAAQMRALHLSQLSAIKETVEKEQIDCELLLRRSYDIFFDAEQAASFKAWLQERHRRADNWLQDVQWLEGPHLDQILGVRGAKGATSVAAASLWPYKFVTQLLARCLDMGATLYTHTPVNATQQTLDGDVLLSTTRGDCIAKRVVYATNGYLASLLPPYRGVITPIRGTACHIVAKPTSSSSSPPHLTNTYNLHYDKDYIDYLVPQPDGSVVLGGGSQTYRHNNALWLGTVDDAHLIHAAWVHFDAVMRTHFLGWDQPGIAIQELWTGIMGRTPDRMPHVGKVPGSPNEFLLAGFNGGGMAMIFTTAKAVSRMVLENASFADSGLPACFESTEARIQAAKAGQEH